MFITVLGLISKEPQRAHKLLHIIYNFREDLWNLEYDEDLEYMKEFADKNFKASYDCDDLDED